MSSVSIIPGSFKPPHKGHLSLIEKIIKKDNDTDIIIIISQKARPLDSRFLYMEKTSKIELENALKEYIVKNNLKISNLKDGLSHINFTKAELIKLINKLMSTNVIKTINAKQSLEIWNIYLEYLKKKYQILPKIEIRISSNPNPILGVNRSIINSFREKYKKILLLKSKKNSHNTRFDFLEKKYGKYVKTKLFPNIKNIDATGMRKSILEKNKIDFFKYLPADMLQKYKNKIWKIVMSKYPNS